MAFSKESKQYWETYVNDIEVAQHEVGTREFFEDLRTFRYDANRMGYSQPPPCGERAGGGVRSWY